MILIDRIAKLLRIVEFAALTIVYFCLQGTSLAALNESSAVRPADTSSPQATLKSFVEACNEAHDRIVSTRYFDRTSPEHHPIALRILDCLDRSELPEYEQLEFAGEAAVCIKEILDRVELPPYDEIPDADDIEAAEGEQKLSRWRIPGTRITIARVEEGSQRHEYLFSAGTVGRAVEYYHDIESLPYRKTGPEVSPRFYRWYVSAPGRPVVARIVDVLPDWFRERTLGLSHWQWLGAIVAIITGLFLMGVCYKLYSRFARKYRNKKLPAYCLIIVFPILAVLIPLGFRVIVVDYLTLRGTPLYAFSFAANLTALLAAMLVVFAMGNRIAAIIIASPHINPQGLDAQFIRIITKLVSVIAVVIVFLEGGNNLGIPVTTLIASAGIGGLAIALAAQDTLKNIFGTIMLLTDKPCRVGERIIFDKYDGVIEDIGLRSTRIRLLTGHQATIPNDKLASSDIENVGRRPYIRRTATIGMPSNTPTSKVKRALEIVRAAVEDHEGMQEDFPPRVFLRDLNESSIGIFLIYWYHPPLYWDYLAFSEKVNLQIMAQLEAEGIPFAAPGLRVQMSDHEKAVLNAGTSA